LIDAIVVLGMGMGVVVAIVLAVGLFFEMSEEDNDDREN